MLEPHLLFFHWKPTGEKRQIQMIWHWSFGSSYSHLTDVLIKGDIKSPRETGTQECKWQVQKQDWREGSVSQRTPQTKYKASCPEKRQARVPPQGSRAWPYQHLDLGFLDFSAIRQCISEIFSHSTGGILLRLLGI